MRENWKEKSQERRFFSERANDRKRMEKERDEEAAISIYVLRS